MALLDHCCPLLVDARCVHMMVERVGMAKLYTIYVINMYYEVVLTWVVCIHMYMYCIHMYMYEQDLPYTYGAHACGITRPCTYIAWPCGLEMRDDELHVQSDGINYIVHVQLIFCWLIDTYNSLIIVRTMMLKKYIRWERMAQSLPQGKAVLTDHRDFPASHFIRRLNS